MFRSREHAYEAAEHELESPLRLLRLNLREWRLFAHNSFQFGNEVRNKQPVGAKRLQQGLTPGRQFGITLAEQRSHKAPKRLHQGRIGDVSLVLVEFTGRE